MSEWQCVICGYIYDPAKGDPENGIEAGTSFNGLPDDWVCPLCGAEKDQFEEVTGEDDDHTEVGAEEGNPSSALNEGQRFIIVGMGVAGMTAARTLRHQRPTASITVIGAEPHLYYYRPNLIQYLAGQLPQDDLVIYDEKWYRDNSIDVRKGTEVTAINTSDGSVETAAGSAIPYDQLLLATGANSFVPPIDGAEKAGVLTLRNMADADEIGARAEPGSSAVVIGGGLLGLETAAALAHRGVKAVVLERGEHLLKRQLDSGAGEIIQGLLEERGLEIRTNASISRILGDASVNGVQLDDNAVIEANLVVIAAGVRCDIQLARAAGLEVDAGILVNAAMETSVSGIYASGDAAQLRGSRPIGIVPFAIDQAKVAAANMAESGSSTYLPSPPSNTLKVVGVDLTSIGEATASGAGYREVVEADHNAGRYKKLVIKSETRADTSRGTLAGAIWLGEKVDVEGLEKSLGESVKDENEARGLLRKLSISGGAQE